MAMKVDLPEEDKVDNLPTPHDSFFVAAMHIISVAEAFFKGLLSPELSTKMNFKTLKLENSTFVNSGLRKSHSDMIYSVEMADMSIPVYIVTEQQSNPENNMPFRVHHYLFNFLMCRTFQEKYKKLPPVHALVFYTGKRSRYPHSMALTDCFNDPHAMMNKLFHGEVELVNANKLKRRGIRMVKWLGPMVQAMTSIRMPDITNVAVQIFEDLALYGGDAYEQQQTKALTLALLTYFEKAGKIRDKQRFFSLIERLPEHIRGLVMTFGQELREEGRIEGKAEGKAQDATRMLAKGYSIDEIRDITLLSIEQIEALKNVPAQNESDDD